MAIILYYALPSANSERVRMALYVKRLPYESIVLNLAKLEQKKPEFLRLNPYGKVPVLIDDGKALFESCIINDYLDERYPLPPLNSDDPFLRARGRVLVDYALTHLHDRYWSLRCELRKDESQRDALVVLEARRTIAEQLVYLEAALANQNYFLGAFGLVDINLWPRLSRLKEWGALPALSLPNLSSWVERMSDHPAVRHLRDETGAASALQWSVNS